MIQKCHRFDSWGCFVRSSMQGARQNDPRPSACRLRRQRVFALRLAVSNGARHAGAADLRLFFRWIKHHLRLRGFFSTDPNGVRVQIWTALCAYLLVAIAKRENALPGSLHQVLQVISIAALEKIPLSELFAKLDTTNGAFDTGIQLEISGF